ncbi:MAG TPA: AMP-binding protein, partial [Nitrospiria bacterium]|nr:AMP-binding protein [Nitrospiria bacterium]
AILLVLMSPLTFLARPERWLWAIHRYRGTLSSAPNFAYELCLRKIDDTDIEGLDLSSWRMALNGAEAVSPETILGFTRRFEKYGFRPETMAPVYGLAESTVGLTFPPPGRRPMIDRINRQTFMRSGYAMPVEGEEDSEVLRFVACGQPLPGHQMRIVDATGHEAGERQEGRLEFKGPSATSGYFRNPAETRRLFHGEWLDSGDLGYMVGGDVFITGRVKDIIIRAGRTIYPHELEEAIGNIPEVRKGCVAVFGSTDPVSQTERLVLVAETRETDAGALETLRGRINTEAVNLVGTPPDDIVLVPPHTVPKTSSGKIRRTASRDLYEQAKLTGRPRSVWRQYLRLASL